MKRFCLSRLLVVMELCRCASRGSLKGRGMGKGRVLKIYDSRAIFENYENGNCLVITQIKDGWPTKDIQVIDRNQLAECNGQYLTLTIEAIYGFYDLLSCSYVAVVTESENFLSINNIDIRKALKILVIPLFRNTRFLSESKQKDEDKYLELLQTSFTQHQFFYSLTTDLTSTQQRKAKYSQTNSNKFHDPLWVRANIKYFWNRDLIHDLITASADDWIIPFMSGYIEFRPGCEIDNDRFAMLFISRRSKMRQGCRFTKRGIDENGYVANYVETEQILIFPDGKITSYVQIRGSIPLLWSSPVHMKWDPKVYIDEERIKSAEYCHKHIYDINNDTSDHTNNLSQILFINLIDNKKDQGKLGVEFKEVLDLIRPNTSIQLKYIWFDFHHETKQKGKWQNLSKLIKIIDDILLPSSNGYFCRLSSGEIISWQNYIIRTNCMDNLDRTNVVQSIIARRSLLLQLQRKDLLTSNNNVLEIPFKKFEIIYKTIWANNANEMSNLYAGTGALKVDFTKTGKRTWNGMINDGINACMRYYINNFLDGNKQDGIDLLLGLFKPDPLGPSPFHTSNIRKDYEHETIYENINKIFILLVLIFTFFLIFSPQFFLYFLYPSYALTLTPRQVIRIQILLSVFLTFLFVMYITYIMIKKGSKLGEKLVVHPVLVPDPMIQRTSSSNTTTPTLTPMASVTNTPRK